MKILLVEDDTATAQFLSATLTADQYAVDVATDGQMCLALAKQWEYDLIVLDVMIPHLDGISVCRQLRAQENQTPVLLLTAKGSNQDIVTGLDAGADDYLTKPFDLSQLLARIRALLRRRGAAPSSLVLTWGDLKLDMVATQVTYQQQVIDLRSREYKLLELFLRHPLRVFSRNAIIDQIWTSDDFPTEGAVTNLIKDLRQRLKRAGVVGELIETVYGLGYRLKTAPEKKPAVELPDRAIEQPAPTQLQGIAAIAQAKEWFQASLEQRLQRLEEVEQALQRGSLTSLQGEQAKAELHKLIGGLGTFGYAEAVSFVLRLETLLGETSRLTLGQIQEFSQQLAALKQAIVRPETRAEARTTEEGVIGAAPAPEVAEPTVVMLSHETTLSQPLLELLRPWGIRAILVTHPEQFWELLTTITPDLLLLDTEMSLDNFELCRSIRRDPTWGNLPIVIMTAEANPEFIQEIFAAGGDDFVRKPVIEPEFVSRVVSRVERLRTHKLASSHRLQGNQQTEIDPLTQLVNRRYFLQSLQIAWTQRTPLALMLCDVDQFDLYNDHYGYAMGDKCLKQIAHILQQSIEPATGQVARYSGDKFAILLLRTPLERTLHVVEVLQQSLAKLNLSHAPTAVHPLVTLSIGITGTTPTPEKSSELLLTTVDQALHAAKWRGRNTFCLYPL